MDIYIWKESKLSSKVKFFFLDHFKNLQLLLWNIYFHPSMEQAFQLVIPSVLQQRDSIADCFINLPSKHFCSYPRTQMSTRVAFFPNKVNGYPIYSYKWKITMWSKLYVVRVWIIYATSIYKKNTVQHFRNV